MTAQGGHGYCHRSDGNADDEEADGAESNRGKHQRRVLRWCRHWSTSSRVDGAGTPRPTDRWPAERIAVLLQETRKGSLPLSVVIRHVRIRVRRAGWPATHRVVFGVLPAPYHISDAATTACRRLGYSLL